MEAIIKLPLKLLVFSTFKSVWTHFNIYLPICIVMLRNIIYLPGLIYLHGESFGASWNRETSLVLEAPLVRAASSYFRFSRLFSLAFKQVCFVVLYERNNI